MVEEESEYCAQHAEGMVSLVGDDGGGDNDDGDYKNGANDGDDCEGSPLHTVAHSTMMMMKMMMIVISL